MSSPSILMLHRKPNPCTHAELETIYTHLLPQRGYRVVWVMPSGNDESIRGWKMTDWNGTQVYLMRDDSRAGLTQKLAGRFRDQYRVVRNVMKYEPVDILQVRNDWIGGLVCAWAQRRWGVPFVYQISFPNPEMLDSLGGWRRVLGLVWKNAEKLLLREAAMVLPISTWMQAQFEACGVPAEKMVNLPLGIDASVRPEDVDSEEVRNKFGLNNRRVVIYFGEMGRTRRLDFLLRAMAEVVKEVPNVKFLMVGKSARGEGDVEWLKATAMELGIREHVIFTGFVPRTEVPRYIRAANVGVSPIVPLPLYRISSPTKLFETLGMARPIVGNNIPEQELVLRESGAGFCTPYEEGAFARAIVWLLQHPEEAQVMGLKGRKYVEEHRSYEVLAQKVDDAYRKISPGIGKIARK